MLNLVSSSSSHNHSHNKLYDLKLISNIQVIKVIRQLDIWKPVILRSRSHL